MRPLRAFPILAALLLTACAGDSKPPPTPSPAPAPLPAPAAAPLPAPPESLPPVPVSVIAPPKPDQCGAYLLGDIVGRPRTEIPVPVDPTKRRVVCTTCPTTTDFRADRVTIEYDATTGKVTKVGCG